jgi:hypothetical protein
MCVREGEGGKGGERHRVLTQVNVSHSHLEAGQLQGIGVAGVDSGASVGDGRRDVVKVAALQLCQELLYSLGS